MRCPFCGHTNTSVKDSRATDDNAMIRRRRHCPDCGARFTTVENVQLLSLRVKKKSGEVEHFKREKIFASLKLALQKRPIDDEKIEKITNSIIRRLESCGEIEISSQSIGEIVMETLHDLDSVAYVRFASVYKDFREVGDFANFIDEVRLSKGKLIE
jgi:transcriptional repressor NrdR